MGGFVKETRSLHPAEGTALLTVEEVWGGDEGYPPWLRFPCQFHAAPRGELLAFRSLASGEGSSRPTRKIVSVREFF